MYKYLFGPVPSRRLGLSLGVDLVPYKVCSLDCIYCEVGKTTIKTIERKEYIPTDELIKELDDYLKNCPHLDFITLSGAGEPTLHSKIGYIIDYVKTNYPQYKMALITNSTLLFDSEIRKQLLKLDLILPSLDAVTDKIFQQLNRPDKHLDMSKIADGLVKFSKEFKGKIWLEIFLSPNLNDTSDEISKMKKIIAEMNPERVQLNTLDRPGTEEWVQPISHEKLEQIAEWMQPLPVEIIAKAYNQNTHKKDSFNLINQIVPTITRRPCTIDDLVSITGENSDQISIALKEIARKYNLITEEKERGVFFKIDD